MAERKYVCERRINILKSSDCCNSIFIWQIIEQHCEKDKQNLIALDEIFTTLSGYAAAAGGG